MEQDTLPPLLRLPLELRYHIYSLLLVDLTPEVHERRNLASIPQYAKSPTASKQYHSIQHYHKYETSDEDVAYTPSRIVSFRSIDPKDFSEDAHKKNKLRTSYTIREGRFRAQCMATTYQAINRPDIDTNILGVCHQIYDEAAPVLYGNYTFDFDTHIEGCIPFLSDLTPYSRNCIRRVKVVKRALPYEKDFDRCEWTNMCRYISTNLSLVTLSLGVVSGKPRVEGWTDIRPFPESEIEGIVHTYKRDEMTWVRDLMLIKGLKKLDVSPYIEHCPPATSNSMAFFIAFSASVDTGFTTYLTNQMLHVAPAA